MASVVIPYYYWYLLGGTIFLLYTNDNFKVCNTLILEDLFGVLHRVSVKIIF